MMGSLAMLPQVSVIAPATIEATSEKQLKHLETADRIISSQLIWRSHFSWTGTPNEIALRHICQAFLGEAFVLLYKFTLTPVLA